MLGWPARVRRLVVAGIGDAAINALHDPAEIQALAEAFACPEAPAHPDSSAARIRSHALRAGNDLRALLPFAEADEHMAETDALVAALRAALDFLLARDP